MNVFAGMMKVMSVVVLGSIERQLFSQLMKMGRFDLTYSHGDLYLIRATGSNAYMEFFVDNCTMEVHFNSGQRLRVSPSNRFAYMLAAYAKYRKLASTHASEIDRRRKAVVEMKTLVAKMNENG